MTITLKSNIEGTDINAWLVEDRLFFHIIPVRVADPLSLMGARIETTAGGLPATVSGGRLRGITYRMPTPSAQVKSASCWWLARGTTTVVESFPPGTIPSVPWTSAWRHAGAEGVRDGGHLSAADVTVPGDLSSAAFCGGRGHSGRGCHRRGRWFQPDPPRVPFDPSDGRRGLRGGAGRHGAEPGH
jgi:hypothetical protein